MSARPPSKTKVGGARLLTSPAAARVDARPTATARDLLLPYQRGWSDDHARFKLGIMARQTGKDFASGDEGIGDCFEHEIIGDKTTWLIAAPSERQSLESLGKWKEWVGAYGLTIADEIEERETKNSEALLKSSTIVFPNGSRVIAVPGKPETVRGFTANVLCTEAAFFEDFDATWRALLPSITNPLRGGPKKVRLITTPNGQGNRIHELWKRSQETPSGNAAADAERAVPADVRSRIEQAIAAAAAAGRKTEGMSAAEAQMRWSCHFVDIYRAVKDGLPANLYELYAGMDDPAGWAQEFECQFLDAATVLLPYEAIALCESETATAEVDPEYWSAVGQFPVDLGIDFGRKKDLTVCWACEAIGDLQLTKEILCLEKMSTPDQVDALRPRLRKARRAALDYTGPGVGLGDYLVKEFGEWKPAADLFGKIELVTMSNPVKVEIFSKLAMAFQARKLMVPIQRVLREDLHSVYRVVTGAGNVTYRAPHTPDGHADRCTSAALVRRAFAAGAGPFAWQPIAATRPGLLGAYRGSIPL